MRKTFWTGIVARWYITSSVILTKSEVHCQIHQPLAHLASEKALSPVNCQESIFLSKWTLQIQEHSVSVSVSIFRTLGNELQAVSPSCSPGIGEIFKSYCASTVRYSFRNLTLRQPHLYCLQLFSETLWWLAITWLESWPRKRCWKHFRLWPNCTSAVLQGNSLYLRWHWWGDSFKWGEESFACHCEASLIVSLSVADAYRLSY